MTSNIVTPNQAITREPTKMTQTAFEIWLHVILYTKNNKPLLDLEWRSKFFYFLKRTARDNDIYIDYIDGVEDHLHILLKLNPKMTPQSIINKIKRSASIWFKENKVMKAKFAWSPENAIISVSPSQVSEVRTYIKRQKEFHKEFPLSDELIILQKK